MLWLILLIVPGVAIAIRPGVPTSRRILACAFALAVPGPGVVLALLVRRTRGGTLAAEPAPVLMPRAPAYGTIAAQAGAASIVDRLVAGDPGERLTALVMLSSSGDAQAVATLRWVVEHGPNDVVIEAALMLDELDRRCEQRLATAVAARTAAPSVAVEQELAIAEAAALRIDNGLADAPLAQQLVDLAVTAYRRARALAPARAAEFAAAGARLATALCAAVPRRRVSCTSIEHVDPIVALDLPGLDRRVVRGQR